MFIIPNRSLDLKALFKPTFRTLNSVRMPIKGPSSSNVKWNLFPYHTVISNPFGSLCSTCFHYFSMLSKSLFVCHKCKSLFQTIHSTIQFFDFLKVLPSSFDSVCAIASIIFRNSCCYYQIKNVYDCETNDQKAIRNAVIHKSGFFP